MFGTLIVPLVLQNTTHLVGRAVESKSRLEYAVQFPSN
jgi:hypothetical protein